MVTERDVLEFAKAAAVNAAALCDDSGFLASRNSPRAIGLAILAAEELGKAWQAVAALQILRSVMDGVTDLEGDPDELLELAVKSGTHSEKMTAMLALETIIPMLAGVQADALGTVFKRATGREANDLKQRSLYTDFVAGGHPREPSLVLEDEWAQELRTAICKSVVVWSILLPQVAEQTVTEGARETDARSSPA